MIYHIVVLCEYGLVGAEGVNLPFNSKDFSVNSPSCLSYLCFTKKNNVCVFLFSGGFRNGRFLAGFLQNLLFGFVFMTITDICLFIGSSGSSGSLGLSAVLDDNPENP